ncbi:MAG: SCO family protein [Steroidobacteraceae bacterium]
MVLAAAALLAVVAYLMRRPAAVPRAAPAALQSVLWPEARPVAAFHMRTQRGDAFGVEQFRGQWSFVFFGYLSCPDICPTTLQTLAAFRRRLLASDPRAGAYRFVFVSVDPANDDAGRMAAYLAYFDPDFVGLVGEDGELARLARSMGAAYAEHIDERGVRSIEHSTTVLLVDPAGRVVGGLPAPHDPERMLALFEDLRRYLAG